MSTEKGMLNHKSSMDSGPSSARPPGMPSSSTPCEPSSSKGPKHASEMRMKRRHRHEKVLRPSLKSTVLPKHLPSKLKSLTPRQQLNQKVEEYVRQLLADIPSLAPALATGHIYTASTVDKLFCMILFSPLLIQILTKMLGVWDCEEVDERDVDILPSAISLMTKGSQAANQGQAGSGPGQDQLLQQDNLGQPETWGDLFLAWAPRKLLPIGLYRRDPHTQFPYVYTSPTKATILRNTDMVYVLASSFDLP
ncbi:hypothetical protein DUNSADRAFT_15317 [Dunaliella salina]|uniref:Uncharacterized protein n=1 Tax=Dunaliella salina TaxID=3046 RepID=A0ABQ7G5R4_DUNSA|nr:hypothetical protein DUNSADRAFT_15317 [Dunaliella salina]|eukprot:KAF5829917.1 hypothetical protein DUNSADRAFT_15317 [Dunaliella salina]